MPAEISPRKLEAAMSAAMQVKATLPDDDDVALLLGSLEGETQVLDLIDRLAEQAIADRLLADQANERARRLTSRADRHRAIIQDMMAALELTEPLRRALYTATLSYHRKAIVTDQDALPPELIRHAPDMRAVDKALRAGGDVEGAVLSNPEPRLTLRTL